MSCPGTDLDRARCPSGYPKDSLGCRLWHANHRPITLGGATEPDEETRPTL